MAGLLDRQSAFVVALREAGLTISVAEGLDAVRSMQTVDLLDREQLRAALAASLVKRHQHRPAFDTAFDLFYPAVSGESVAERTSAGAPPRDPGAADRGPLEDSERDRLRAELAEVLAGGDEARMDAVAREAVDAFGAVPGRGRGQSSWSRLAVLSRVSAATLMASVLDAVLQGADRGGVAERRARTMIDRRIARFEQQVGADVARRLAEESDVESVARTAVRPSIDRVAFLSATRDDLAALRREIAPLARRLATRLAMDRHRGRRGTLDVRRTMRAALSTGGVPMDTHHRPRRPAKTDLVVICDLSESVSSFAHFTLLLVYALREQFTRVRAFGFVDELDELTRFFTPGGDVLDTVTRLTAEADVTWVTGRTDYGRAFELFEHRFPDVVGTRSSLLVLGDARSNYGRLALPQLSRLAGAARHAYWLNPERESMWDTGDSRASDFAAVVPMTECRNLAQLSEFVRDLAPR
ncbi:VWA domain-containing protein [Jatrophihabitans endophyticus]|uniref:VWA domain-containing protein n=1 Tax=Jatrophihabitans endophyticus TaxID=1206085 RepID=UPI001A0EB5BB|nr:VWA domain-containing protein [Jatrophihabitans endophyticus]MBE7186746.1 VWA domain-containing protein [Jatrophihabitans endophyticus]